MPPAIPLIAAAAASYVASSAVAIAAFGALGASALGAVTSFAISKLGSSLIGGSKKNNAQAPSFDRGLKTIIRLSDDAQKVIYGRARIGGTLAYVESTNTANTSSGVSRTGDNLFLHMVIVHAGHEVDAIEEIYLNDLKVTINGSGFVNELPYNVGGKSYVRIIHQLGTDTQAANSLLISESPNWTAKHRLRGLAYTYMRLEYNADVFQTGIPTLNVVSRGKKVYDPRSGLTVWSENPALCVRDYLTARDNSGVSIGFGALAAEIDDSFTIASANICDELVTKLDSSTIARYTCNGVIDTSQTPLDNVEDMLTSMVGAITVPRGTFRIHAGAYTTPESTVVDDTWLTGSIRSRHRIARQELFNAVRGLYVSPAKDWQSDSFPEIISPAFEAQDAGERIYTDISLPFTIDGEMAQRIARIVQRKSREQISVTLPVNYKALQYTVWDTIKYTNTTRGWSEKVFRIVNMTFDMREGIVWQLREENADSYSWTATDAQAIESAPDTNLPSPFVVGAPGDPTLNETLYETRGSAGVKALATVSWGASSDPFVLQYQAEYKLISDAEYKIIGRTADTSIDIFDINPGRYAFRVKAINQLGVSSSYADGEPKEVYGLLANPLDITNFSLAAMSSLAVLRWDTHPDLDVRLGGKIHIRHSAALTGAVWEESYSITDALDGISNMAVVPLKAGTYLAKAIDSTGQYSVNAVSVSTKNATVLAFSTLGTIQEDGLFTGTNNNTFVDGGLLKLGGGGLFDDIPDFDAVLSLDYYGGSATSGTYTFATGYDGGVVGNFRLDTTMAAQVINILDLVDSRDSLIDDWQDFDGTVGVVSADAYIEVRETDDDPSGSPTWSSWRRVLAADYTARAIQLRVVLVSFDPAYSIQLSQLRATIRSI